MRSLAVLAFVFLIACASTPATVPTATSSVAPAVTSTAAAQATASGSACTSKDGLPDPTCTPGVADPRVTQANIGETICKAGYSASVRPPTSVTTPIKAERMKAYGYTGAPAGFELDHLISLELGGHPSDVRNLWPEAYGPDWDAARKDQVEDKLHDLVCARTITLEAAQHSEATDWRAAWTQYVGPTKTATAAPRAATPTPVPSTATAAPASVFYQNCTVAKAAHAAPLYRGQPGYRDALDGDHDGIACE